MTKEDFQRLKAKVVFYWLVIPPLMYLNAVLICLFCFDLSALTTVAVMGGVTASLLLTLFLARNRPSVAQATVYWFKHPDEL